MPIVEVKLMTQYTRKRGALAGTHAIVIYVNENKPQYVPTGYSARPDQFVEGQSNWVRKHSDATIINAKVEDKRQEVIKSIVPGVGYVEGYSRLGNNGNFCDYIRKRSKQFEENQQIDMVYKMNRLVTEIVTMHKRDLYFSEVNMDWIRAYVAYCYKLPNEKNTVMKKVKRLRTLYGQAVKEGIAAGDNPFKAYDLTWDPVRREKLTRDEVARIEALDIEPGSFLFHVRNAFLISFYCQGMRFQNVCMLKWDSVAGGHIHYQMNKGKKWRSIQVHPKLQAILDYYKGNAPYILPFLKEEIKDAVDLRKKIGSANAMVNQGLKVIGRLANIATVLRFHIGRHTFAYTAKILGVSTDTVKDSLGHGDVKMTEVYLLSLSDDHINDAVKVVWE